MNIIGELCAKTKSNNDHRTRTGITACLKQRSVRFNFADQSGSGSQRLLTIVVTIQWRVAGVRLFYERFEYSEEFHTIRPEGRSDNLFRIV